MQPLATCEAAVLRQLREAERVYCLLDYDGTLAPLAPTPDEAHPLPGTQDLLRKLTTPPGMEVAIITGRTIADLRRFINVSGIHYAGGHGMEIEWSSGQRWQTRGAGLVRAALPSMRKRIERALTGRRGILIEDKGAALACHYRLASNADAALARYTVAAIVRDYERIGVPVALMHGHAVSEIRPVSVTKGEAVRTLLAACPREPLAVCIGDDQTDADAFRALPQDAITVQVGTADALGLARYCLPGPVEVQHFLLRLLACRSTQGDREDTARGA